MGSEMCIRDSYWQLFSMKLTLCRAGSHDLDETNQGSLSSSHSDWFRDGPMMQVSQSKQRGHISRDFVGSTGEMGSLCC